MKKMKEKTADRSEQKVERLPWNERLSNYFCPILLGGIVCFAVMYVLYRPLAPLYTALYMVAEFVLFSIFDILKNKKAFGGLIYIGLLFIAVFFAMYLMFTGAMSYGFMSPVTWFYGEEGSYSYQPYYLNAVFIGGGFFVLSVLYYFTQIRYRNLGVMMCILFPFVIYAKRADEMPEVIVTLIITLYLAVVVHNRRIDPGISKDKRGKLIVNRAYIISIALFVSVTGAVTMMLELPVYRSKLEQNSNYFDVYQTQGTGSGNYEEMSEVSSSRSGGLEYTYNPLFYMQTSGDQFEYYLRRQCYDHFNGEVWESTIDDYRNVYSSVLPEYSNDDIIADMKRLYDEGNISVEPDVNSLITKQSAYLYDENFAPYYLPAPIGAITDTAEFSKLNYRKYPTTVIIRANSREENGQISALNDRFDFNEHEDELYEYAHELGYDGTEYVTDLINFSVTGSEVAQELLADYYAAANSSYLQDTDGISDEIKALAEEITADCTSDIEKAEALVNYFATSGYVYSLEYVPEDMSIDYFIFESKTGYCVAYATAFTLMARSVGLPTRYVEGFAAFERTDDNAIVVRDGHAHAFCEVYIPGAGWLTFDPTVADYRDTPTPDNNFNAALFLRLLSRFLVVIIVGFVVIFVLLLDRIVELIFRIRICFKAPKDKVLMLYSNLIKLVNFSTKSDYSAYTVKMLREYLRESRGVVPEGLLELFERTAFGGYEPSEAEFDEIYLEYKKYYKYLRKIPKPKELEKLRTEAPVT